MATKHTSNPVKPLSKHFQPGHTPANKGKKYPPEILTDREVQKLVQACSNRAPTGIRNRALIVVLYRGGLRIAEALALWPKDVNCTEDTIRVLTLPTAEHPGHQVRDQSSSQWL